MNTQLVIQIENVTKDYVTEDVTTKVLHDIDLVVKKGEFIAITGPSGSGKSTLLNILGLLDTPTSGKYILNGNDITKLTEDELSDIRNKEIGFVFQQFNLLKRITVLENVILPAIYSGMNSSKRTENAKELLSRVGLAEQIHKRPNQLSGGHQQRVAIARALVNQPEVIFADEPTGNLDSENGSKVEDLLFKLNREKGITLIVVTHDIDLAKRCQRRFLMKDGHLVEGKHK